MTSQKLLRRTVFLLLYHFYAKSKISKTDYFELFGFSFVVPPTVFHPALYFSSKILGKYLTALDLQDKKVLDLGCGSGILSLIAASKGASVTAVDINPEAVEATKENATRNQFQNSIVVYEGNLFEPLGNTQLFDFILLNPPFYPHEPKNLLEAAWKSGKNHKFINDFIKELAEHLTTDGKAIFILTTEMDIFQILNQFKTEGFTTKCVVIKHVLFETFFIYEASCTS